MPENNIEVHERIAILETKVDSILEELKGIGETLHTFESLYKMAKWITWAIGFAVGFTHWPELIAFVDNWLHPPKHP